MNNGVAKLFEQTWEHEFHKTCHSVTFIVLVNSHQRWKQTRNRVYFHLWCELTPALWCHSTVREFCSWNKMQRNDKFHGIHVQWKEKLAICLQKDDRKLCKQREDIKAFPVPRDVLLWPTHNPPAPHQTLGGAAVVLANNDQYWMTKEQ